MTYKPDKHFHPTGWIQSLEDTPEMYKLKQTKDVPLRREILRYLANGDANQLVQAPEWTIENIAQEIPAVDVQFLNIFDLKLNEDFTFTTTKVSLNGTSKTASPSNSVSSRSKVNGKKSKEIVSQNEFSNTPLEDHQKALFNLLNDSLVDLGTKYRILFAQRCCPSIVKAFIYMWHPDALDTFDNYFGSSSRFADSRETTWITTITISHWSVRPSLLAEEVFDRFKEHRSTGDFPPESVAKLGFSKATATKANGDDDYPSSEEDDTPQTMDVVEERSSSLVITGHPQGFLWTCTIWSSLTDPSAIASTIDSIPEVLQTFINQQSSGRCLVFLILLGHLCERLADEYNSILTTLDRIVELGEKVLLEGLDWEANNAVDKLKKMLWGLEALRVFDDRLSASLTQIQKARDAMEASIQEDLPLPQHSAPLLTALTSTLDAFSKRHTILLTVQVRINLKINQVSNLQDSISTVTNVEDSRTALRDSRITIKQGNNIRVLTLITIAYLPLGFVAALFSMGHSILPDSAGGMLFTVLIVCFVVATYGIALYLESVIEVLEGAVGRVRMLVVLKRSSGKGGKGGKGRYGKGQGSLIDSRRKREDGVATGVDMNGKVAFGGNVDRTGSRLNFGLVGGGSDGVVTADVELGEVIK